MEPEALRAALREGCVTRTVEKGEVDEANRYRVTSYAPTRRLRLLFTAKVEILQTGFVAKNCRRRQSAP